jgi:hypothetical protein
MSRYDSVIGAFFFLGFTSEHPKRTVRLLMSPKEAIYDVREELPAV